MFDDAPTLSILRELVKNYICVKDNNYLVVHFNADEDGWMTIEEVAKLELFTKVTSDSGLIKEVFKSCKLIEIKDEKMRKRMTVAPLAQGDGNQNVINHEGSFLADKIQKASFLLDYYFSNENLRKDFCLIDEMDEQGWVPMEYVADLEELKSLAVNDDDINKAIPVCVNVDRKGFKLRKKGEWQIWLSEKNLKKEKKKWFWQESPPTSSKKSGDMRSSRRY